jgi:UDPglucose 6-dehydrogenase
MMMEVEGVDTSGAIAIVGLWHQGVVAAAVLADLGCDVVATDADTATVRGLNAGRAPVMEPGLDALVAKGVASGRLRFVEQTQDAVMGRGLVMVMHDTPVDADDRSDLTPVFDACRAMAAHLDDGTVVLVTAQVPVGTCDQLAAAIREEAPGADFHIAYAPENLRLGQAIELFRKPALPVLGADDEAALDALEESLSVLEADWSRVSLRTGEMVKHALNAYLATTITFGNELGNLCDEVGADGMTVAEALRREPRVGPKAMLLPGLGFAGGTLARDIQTLRKLGNDRDVPTPLLDGVMTSNRNQNSIVVKRLLGLFGDLDGRRIAVLGLTYKPDTSTLRRSVALEIIDDITSAGGQVVAHDPGADPAELSANASFEFTQDVYEAVRDAEALVLITGWATYRDLDFGRINSLMARPYLLDPGNFLDGENLKERGFTYRGTGRGA